MCLRVLQVLPELSSGGVERGTLEIASALLESGHIAVVASAGGNMVSELKKSGAVHVTLPLNSKNPFVIFLNVLRIYKVLKLYKINLLHARSRAPAWSAYLASRLANIPFVTTFHGAYGASNTLKKYYNQVMLKGVKTIVVSEFIRKHVMENYGVDRKRLVLIDRGVDTEYFNPAKVSEERIQLVRQSVDVGSFKKVILCPGRFTRLKGHLYLLHILAKLQTRNTAGIDWCCIMVGDAVTKHQGYISEIKNAAVAYGLEKRLQVITNAVSDMPALYMLSDIVVVPSVKPEAFGRTIIEGQAMGRIVVATTLGGVAEYAIRHGISGFQIPADSSLDASNILYNALQLKDEDSTIMGRHAMENVKFCYSLESMCKKTLALYEEIHSMA